MAEDPAPETEPTARLSSPPPERGRGRSGRGRRGGGRGRRPPEARRPSGAEASRGAPDRISEPTGREPESPPHTIHEAQGARSPQTLQQAIEEVNQIIQTLRETLDDMEEVLETLELVERQQNADEQEIETLRRSLRQLHRPREGGHPPARPTVSGTRREPG